MGTNPAVFIANLYLFWYEHKFLASLNTMFSSTPADQPFPYDSLPAGSPLLDHDTSPLLLAGAVTIRDVIRVVVSRFAFTSRVVDDLLSINNPLLSHLLYTSQQLDPIHGVYYPDLRVLPASDTAAGLRPVNYLDLQFVPSRVPGGDAIRLDIKLYR
jgi:hypothetical protein